MLIGGEGTGATARTQTPEAIDEDALIAAGEQEEEAGSTLTDEDHPELSNVEGEVVVHGIGSELERW